MVNSVYSRPGCSATSGSSAMASPRAIIIRWRAPMMSRRWCHFRPAPSSWKVRVADLRGAGRARHLRHGPQSRHRDPARQDLGDLLVLPGAVSWRRSVDRRLHQICLGHADVMLGSVTATEPYWERLSKTAALHGQYVSPDDAYLAARGLRTLGVRLRRHEDSAIKSPAGWPISRKSGRCSTPLYRTVPGTNIGGAISPVRRDCSPSCSRTPMRPRPTASSRGSSCSASAIGGAASRASRSGPPGTRPRNPPRKAGRDANPPAHRARGSGRPRRRPRTRLQRAG